MGVLILSYGSHAEGKHFEAFCKAGYFYLWHRYLPVNNLITQETKACGLPAGVVYGMHYMHY